MNLYYNTTAQCRVDESNTRIAAKPVIHYGSCPAWELHFFSGDPSETPEPVDLSDIISWRAAVDSDWNSNTEPMCRTLDEDIDASQAADGIISVPVNANTQRYLAVVDGKQSVPAWFELRGFDDQGNVTLVVLLNITCSNSIDPTGGAEPEPVDNDTATMTWVKAEIAQQLYYEYSADGSTWHNPPMIPDTDIYFRIRHGQNGTPSAAQLIPYGPEGELSGNVLTFDSVTSNQVTFPGSMTLPVGVLTNAGHYYPVEKGSLTVDTVNDTFTFDVTPYLAYDNVASFSGTWTLYMGAGSSEEITFNGMPYVALTSAASVAIPAGGKAYTLTVDQNMSITFPTAGNTSCYFWLYLTNGATVYSVTIPNNIEWEYGIAPDLSSASSLYRLAFLWDVPKQKWLGSLFWPEDTVI